MERSEEYYTSNGIKLENSTSRTKRSEKFFATNLMLTPSYTNTQPPTLAKYQD